MEIINISRKKLDSLPPLVLPDDIISTECELFRYKNKVLKKLFNYNGLSFANKLFTIEALNAYRDLMPSNFIIPEALVSIGKQIEAFTMPYVEGINLSIILRDGNVSTEEQIYYIKKIGYILEQMKSIRKYSPLTDFYINDLHEANFMVKPENRELFALDLDSLKIAGNKTFPARYLGRGSSLLATAIKKYEVDSSSELGAYVVANENSDLYCYYIVILNYLYGEKINGMTALEFYEYINYLDYLKINSNLLKILESVVSYDRNENPVNYLDSLSSEQIYRARKKVYLRNRR